MIPYTVKANEDGLPSLQYKLDSEALNQLCNTYLGKNILVTNQDQWSDEKIILSYRSQYIIEDVFKEMKDRRTGSWWPMFHWTDSKIRVHALYCTTALLLRALALRRVHQAGINISIKRLLGELESIREVINVFPRKRGQKVHRRQTVLTKTSEVQDRLMDLFELNKSNKSQNDSLG